MVERIGSVAATCSGSVSEGEESRCSGCLAAVQECLAPWSRQSQRLPERGATGPTELPGGL